MPKRDFLSSLTGLLGASRHPVGLPLMAVRRVCAALGDCFNAFKRAAVVSAGAVSLVVIATAMPAQALTLSSAELAAAERLGCVLADDALGYLSEEQFNQRFDETVTDFSEAQVDVIYAKALGYIDGLLYGVPSGQSRVAAERLESYSNSGRCDSGLSAVARTVSL
jgi:hypothetical protein